MFAAKRSPASDRPGEHDCVSSLLSQVGLPTDPGFRHRLAAVLSGGEAQRLVIARALAGWPRYLVADEPTAALDHCTRLRIHDLLTTLKRVHSLALVVVTHDLEVAGHWPINAWN